METGRYISLTYDLYGETDGKVQLIEQATEMQPMTFITGCNQALPSFEEKVKNIDSGTAFEFSLKPEEAFGDYEPEQVVSLPKNLLLEGGHFDADNIHEGSVIPLQDEDGRRFLGTIVEIDEDNVRIDLNHPLAGMTIRFSGKVLENRPATEDEIATTRQHKHCHCGGHCHKDGEHNDHCEHHCHGDGEHNDHCEHHCHGDGECQCNCKD